IQWQQIETEGRHSAKPRLIQSDGSLTLRCVRDMLDEGVDMVRTDDEAVYAELKSYAASLTPNLSGRVELTKTETPLFDLLRIDHQLEAAFERHVYLKSGGNLVIDETEALTVIDVNTAKFTGKKNLSETIFRLNCEAAGEIARQLRLRDIGGIVIIDFIDMETEEEKQALLSHFREVLKNDRNRVNVLGMTALGLVEMTRRKVRRPLSKQLLRDCTLCLGSGHEWTHESIAWNAVREIWRRRRMGDTTAYCIRTGEKVGGWIQTIGLPVGGDTRIEINGTDRAFEILPVASGGNAETGNEETL
ncbi:MAG: ribonuclease E/G, partial [Clostridia bacterium]|nr:ribonuclease E/G [Clostridia bacterium]